MSDTQKAYVVLAKLDPGFSSIIQVVKVFSSKEKANQFVAAGNVFFKTMDEAADNIFWADCKREMARCGFTWDDSIVRMELKKRIPDIYHIYYDIVASDESIYFDGFFYLKEVEIE